MPKRPATPTSDFFQQEAASNKRTHTQDTTTQTLPAQHLNAQYSMSKFLEGLNDIDSLLKNMSIEDRQRLNDAIEADPNLQNKMETIMTSTAQLASFAQKTTPQTENNADDSNQMQPSP